MILEFYPREEFRQVLSNQFIDENKSMLRRVRGADKSREICRYLNSGEADVMIFARFDIDSDI